MYVSSQRELADHIGLTQGYVSRLLRGDGAPEKGPDGYDVEEVRRWHRKRKRRESPRPTGKGSRSGGPRSTRAKSAKRKDKSAKSAEVDSADTPIEILRAAVQLAAECLRASAEDGTLGVREFDALKKATDGLRLGEAALLKLQVERAELLTRDQAAAVAGFLGQRCNEVINDVRSRLAPQVLVWFGDPEFVALPERDKERAVRAWVDDRTHSARDAAARALDELIAEAEA